MTDQNYKNAVPPETMLNLSSEKIFLLNVSVSVASQQKQGYPCKMLITHIFTINILAYYGEKINIKNPFIYTIILKFNNFITQYKTVI